MTENVFHLLGKITNEHGVSESKGMQNVFTKNRVKFAVDTFHIQETCRTKILR